MKEIAIVFSSLEDRIIHVRKMIIEEQKNNHFSSKLMVSNLRAHLSDLHKRAEQEGLLKYCDCGDSTFNQDSECDFCKSEKTVNDEEKELTLMEFFSELDKLRDGFSWGETGDIQQEILDVRYGPNATRCSSCEEYYPLDELVNGECIYCGVSRND